MVLTARRPEPAGKREGAGAGEHVSNLVALLLASAIFLCACSRSTSAAPLPVSIAPPAAHTTADVPVVIKGSGFVLTGARHFGQQGVQVDSTFRAWLGAAPLRQVTWIDDATLSAVVPAGVSGDPLDLTVEGPTGRGVLPGAFRAAASTPAALSAALSVPGSVLVTQAFTVTLTVTNTGGMAANAVAPSALSIAGGSVTVSSGPSPASAIIGAGAAATFSWGCRSNATGAISFSVAATGADANDGGLHGASARASTIAVEVGQIASDPFGNGSPFSYVFDFNGLVYLGPNQAGNGGVRMLPEGSSIQNVTFTFNNDLGQKDANLSGGGLAPYPSLGSTGCAPNTTACGPDNENGRGIYASGLIAGTPCLFASGSLSGGGLSHVYATTDTTTAPDFNYVGLSTVLNTLEAQGSSSMIVYHDRVYLGIPSNRANRPFMMVLNRTPAVPGFDAAKGDAVDLTATSMPGIGAKATTLSNAAPTQMIDSFAIFNDTLYLANNGGWIRSTKGNPGPYATSPGDWAVTIPAVAAYVAKTSVTTTKLADLLPSDRALPQMAVLNGTLYAGRNTTAGPQLWACAPGAKLDCDPPDWSLIAANTIGDSQLSAFNDANNASVTLLVATASHLYVGYDDAVDGVRIYRSTSAAPTSTADFEGQNHCNAAGGSSACPGLGGNGLGTGATRIFDARALTYGGAGYVYLTAGTGTSAVRVFRLPE